jgi:hypothetical protein
MNFKRQLNRIPLCLCLALLFSAFVGTAAGASETLDAAQARYEAVAKAFASFQKLHEQIRIQDLDLWYRWSNWILTAQRDAAVSPAEHATALRQHRRRVEHIRSEVARLVQSGMASTSDSDLAEAYLAEANYWIIAPPH